MLIAAYWNDEKGQTRAFVELIEGPGGTTYKRVLEDVDLAKLQDGAGEFSVQLEDLWMSADAVSGQFVAETGETITLDFTVDACAYWGIHLRRMIAGPWGGLRRPRGSRCAGTCITSRGKPRVWWELTARSGS